MAVPHQHRRSPVLVVLAALGTAGVALLFPAPDHGPPRVHRVESGADAAPLQDSPRLREEMLQADRTLGMLAAMRRAVAETGAQAPESSAR